MSRIAWERVPEIGNLELQQLLDDLLRVAKAFELLGSGRRIIAVTGTPENQTIGSVGDLALRGDGGANTTLYVKESGENTDTGWIAK